MPNNQLRNSSALFAISALAFATLSFVGTTANAAEGCAVGVGSFDVDTVRTDNGATAITLRYDPNSQCAWAVATGVSNASEVWVDRQSPYQGMLGGVRVVNGNGYGSTDTWKKTGKQIRACGTNGRGTAIRCTVWF